MNHAESAQLVAMHKTFYQLQVFYRIKKPISHCNALDNLKSPRKIIANGSIVSKLSVYVGGGGGVDRR